MQVAAEHRAAATHARMPAMLSWALLCGGVVAAVAVGVVQQLGLLASLQMVAFMLSTWLLSTSTTHTAWQALSTDILGVIFITLRPINYMRVAFTPEVPQVYEPLVQSTPLGCAIFVLYMAECGLVQVMLHRLLPAWARVPLAAMQALLFSQCNLRFMKPEQWNAWRVARMIIWSQVGMFGPYYALSHAWFHRLLGLKPSTAVPSVMRGKEKAHQQAEDGSLNQASSKQHVAAGASQQCPSSNSSSAELSLCAGATTVAVQDKQAHTTQPRSMRSSSSNKHVSAVQAMAQAPYKSRLRVAHKVSLKLDTHLTCDRLPPSLVDSLQSAITAGIGSVTCLAITDVAVRPGCIAITLNVEELAAEAAAEDGAAASHSTSSATDPRVWAQALLPQLQALLSNGQGGSPAVQRAVVQLDAHRVLCTWREDSQEWEVQVVPNAGSAGEVGMPRLGIAHAQGLQPVAGPTSSVPSAEITCLWEVVSEVQLWGVTKLTEVEGWEPPAHHLESTATEPDYWSTAGTTTAGSVLRVLAKAGGAYLPTQVVRLVRSTAAGGCATAQVRIQLSESQLVRHHAGGPPSTLLLLGLELWQQEQLLSSTTLLSVPAPTTTCGDAPLTRPGAVPGSACTPAAWWWGARDPVISRAISEVDQCLRSIATAEPAAADATESIGQLMQDLASWLSQMQRIAQKHGICQCRSGAAGCDHQLEQPILSLPTLRNLGQELRDYASYMGWVSVQRMVSEQLRSVVQPAAPPAQRFSWMAAGLRASHTALLGYPCIHDEQLYKQQLCRFLSGMLPVTSAAGTIIGAAVSRKAEGGLAVILWPWMLLQSLALAALVMGRSRASSSMQHGLCNPSVRWAFLFATLACLWRCAGHAALALTISPAAETMYTHVRRLPSFTFAAQLSLVLMEQVFASAMLPFWLLAVALLMSVVAVTADGLRLVLWHPVTSCITALAVVVGAQIVLDAQLRRQLAAPVFAPAATAQRVVTRTPAKPACKRL